MFCPKCGSNLKDNSQCCNFCGCQINDAPQSPPPQINTYLIPAILATCLACVPFGIVAIVYAQKAENFIIIRDYENAMEAARKAKQWFWTSIWSLIAFLACAILLPLFAIIATELS